MLEWIDAGEHRQSELVQLADRSERGLGFHSKQGLAEGTAVLLTSKEDGAVKGIVRRSMPNAEGGYDHGIQLIKDERRRHDRTPLDTLAVLSVVGGAASDLPVRIRDASEGGLLLISPVDIAVDTPVRVEYLDWERGGVVVHSAPRDGAFRIGVQFVGPPEQVL